MDIQSPLRSTTGISFLIWTSTSDFKSDTNLRKLATIKMYSNHWRPRQTSWKNRGWVLWDSWVTVTHWCQKWEGLSTSLFPLILLAFACHHLFFFCCGFCQFWSFVSYFLSCRIMKKLCCVVSPHVSSPLSHPPPLRSGVFCVVFFLLWDVSMVQRSTLVLT